MSNALPRSETTVALLADIPSTGHVGETGARRFAMNGDDVGARSAAFVAFAMEEVRAGRRVVALYPAWRSTDAQKAVNFARGALRTDHIAGISVDLSPLALSLIADQLAYLAPYLPPGMVAALSAELPKHLLAGAWLRTVSGLSTLPTSLRQHMGSYAPTVSFLAYCAPSAQVGRLRPSDVISELPFRPVQPVQLLCSTPDPSITRVFDENLPQAIQPVATRTLPVQPLGSTYWGTSKYVEFVALSAHPQALAYAAGALRAAECAWCGEPVTATSCPFCGGVSSGTTTRTHHGPSTQTAPGTASYGTATQDPGTPRTPSGVRPPVSPAPPGPPGSPSSRVDAVPRGTRGPHGTSDPHSPRAPQAAPAAPATPAQQPTVVQWGAQPHRATPNPPHGTGLPSSGPHPDRPPVPANGHRPSAPPSPPPGPANPDALPSPESPRTFSR